MADKKKKILKAISKLSKRVSKLESTHGGVADSGSNHSKSGLLQCAMPQVPERVLESGLSSHRMEIIRYIEKKWVNGTNLRYFFFDSGNLKGSSENVRFVREAFQIWKNVGIGLDFTEVTNIDEAEVRIGFLDGDGAWSYVGRDILEFPGQRERTMNFGWEMSNDSRGVDVAVHEIGHTLGFPHSHQNPKSGIVWNENAVLQHFMAPPNSWSPDQVRHNILRKIPLQEIEGSNWDPNSIMHYGIAPGLVLQPAEFRNGIRPELGLSVTDKEEVRRFYPILEDDRLPELSYFDLETLDVSPGEQKNFQLNPQNSGEFTIKTVGRSDTLLVLFEDVDGELRFVAGDDDSGTGLNAEINTRLQAGRRYVLRIRLYLNYASGNTGILWI